MDNAVMIPAFYFAAPYMGQVVTGAMQRFSGHGSAGKG